MEMLIIIVASYFLSAWAAKKYAKWEQYKAEAWGVRDNNR